mgnify:CR=1 FL=1
MGFSENWDSGRIRALPLLVVVVTIPIPVVPLTVCSPETSAPIPLSISP